MSTVFSCGAVPTESVWDKAQKKAQNPAMLVKDNPFLAESSADMCILVSWITCVMEVNDGMFSLRW